MAVEGCEEVEMDIPVSGERRHMYRFYVIYAWVECGHSWVICGLRSMNVWHTSIGDKKQEPRLAISAWERLSTRRAEARSCLEGSPHTDVEFLSLHLFFQRVVSLIVLSSASPHLSSHLQLIFACHPSGTASHYSNKRTHGQEQAQWESLKKSTTSRVSTPCCL